MTVVAIPLFGHLNLYTQICKNSRKRVLACRNFNFVQNVEITPSPKSKRNGGVDRWPSMALSTGHPGVQEWPNPTTVEDMIQQIKLLAKDDESRPLLLVNPQWRSTGNIVSDFGFGPWKRQAEEFLNTFESTYILLEQRIGEASNIISSTGGVVRLLKCYPSDWHIYLMAWDGTSDLIGTASKQPTYKQLEQLVSEARKRIPWKSPPRVLGGSEPAPPPLPKSLSGFLSDEQIDQMDKLSLRQALTVLNFPTSGRIEALRERLKEAQKNASK